MGIFATNSSASGTGAPAGETPFGAGFTSPTRADPLIEFNKQFAVIGNIGGKCRVLGWEPSKFDPAVKVPTFQDFRSFTERYAHRYVSVPVPVRQTKEEKKLGLPVEFEEKDKALGATWLSWPERRSYEGIDMEPDGPEILPGDVLNLWSGLSVDPVEGAWPRLQEHITDVLADGDAESAGYIMKYAAWAFQNPGRRGEAALVFRGGKGSGKGTFARVLKDAFGQHGLQIYSPKHMVGNFNAHLRTCLLLFADEAFWAGDKQGESTLKGMLTEPTIPIEQKGLDVVSWKNRLKVIMAANADWVVPASADERRYAVFNVSARQAQNSTYFNKLNHELENGGVAAMLHAMLALDLKGWHPRNIVRTAALEEQKRQSVTPMQEWFSSILESAAIPGMGSDGYVPVRALHEHARDGWTKMRDVSPVAIGRFLSKHGCTSVHRANGTVWQFPALNVMRENWAREFGGQWAWGDEIKEWRGR